jgi:hypothetical protein
MKSHTEVDTNKVLDRIRMIGNLVNVVDSEDYDEDLARQLQLDQYDSVELSRAVDRMVDEGLLRATARELNYGKGGIQRDPTIERVIEITVIPRA